MRTQSRKDCSHLELENLVAAALFIITETLYVVFIKYIFQLTPLGREHAKGKVLEKIESHPSPLRVPSEPPPSPIRAPSESPFVRSPPSPIRAPSEPPPRALSFDPLRVPSEPPPSPLREPSESPFVRSLSFEPLRALSFDPLRSLSFDPLRDLSFDPLGREHAKGESSRKN